MPAMGRGHWALCWDVPLAQKGLRACSAWRQRDLLGAEHSCDLCVLTQFALGQWDCAALGQGLREGAV